MSCSVLSCWLRRVGAAQAPVPSGLNQRWAQTGRCWCLHLNWPLPWCTHPQACPPLSWDPEDPVGGGAKHPG